jgi:hypothetical protein
VRGLAAFLVAIVSTLAGGATAAVDTPHVTVIGDSVLTAVQWTCSGRVEIVVRVVVGRGIAATKRELLSVDSVD